MYGENDKCEIETGNADKIIIERILDIDFITERGGKFRVYYRRDNGKLHYTDYGKIELDYAEKENETSATDMAQYFLEDLHQKYEEEVHPKYENVKFNITKVEDGYKISWDDNVQESLDYDHHEIWLDDSYPFDIESPNFQKIYVNHRPEYDNSYVYVTDRPLRAVKVQAVYR